MKTFFATLAAILVAAGIIFAIKSVQDERARDAKFKNDIADFNRRADERHAALMQSLASPTPRTQKR